MGNEKLEWMCVLWICCAVRVDEDPKCNRRRDGNWIRLSGITIGNGSSRGLFSPKWLTVRWPFGLYQSDSRSICRLNKKILWTWTNFVFIICVHVILNSLSVLAIHQAKLFVRTNFATGLAGHWLHITLHTPTGLVIRFIGTRIMVWRHRLVYKFVKQIATHPSQYFMMYSTLFRWPTALTQEEPFMRFFFLKWHSSRTSTMYGSKKYEIPSDMHGISRCSFCFCHCRSIFYATQLRNLRRLN